MNATAKINNCRGNVTHAKSDDNTWYLKFIRNPKISANAKIVYLNLKTNSTGFDEHVTGLAFKCNLAETAVSKSLKELKDIGLVSMERKHIDGRWKWLYKTFEKVCLDKIIEIQYPQNNGIENNAIVIAPYKYKETNKTNKDDNKGIKSSSLSELNNVENSIIEFSDTADKNKIYSALDKLVDIELGINIPQKKIDDLKLETHSFQNKNPIDKILETISLFPKFAVANKLQPPGYSDIQSFHCFIKILKSDCEYPNWFTKTLKKEQEIQAAKPLEDYTSKWAPVFYVFGSGIYDNLIESKNQFISNSWFQCFNISATPLAKSRVQNLLKKISKDEFIAEYSNILNTEALKKNSDIKEIIDLGIDNILNTISKAFDSVGD